MTFLLKTWIDTWISFPQNNLFKKKIEITQVHGSEEKFTDNKQQVIRRNSHKTTYRKQHNKRDGILMAINEIKKSNMEKH